MTQNDIDLKPIKGYVRIEHWNRERHLKCPHCFKINRLYSRFCRFCKGDLSKAFPPLRTRAMTQKEFKELCICKRCDHENPIENILCEKCGTPLFGMRRRLQVREFKEGR